MLIKDSPSRVSAFGVGVEENGAVASSMSPDVRTDAESDVHLAPLSGITDVPFRRLVRRFGTTVVFSEMVASGEFVDGDAESARRAMAAGAGFHAVQLAGRDPGQMRRAAEKLVGLGVDLIDINMGCPAKKVVGGLSGSALMREPDLALRLVEAAVAGAGSTPVTLKMRLGWDGESLNAPDLARRAQDAGVCRITVHGRTRMQFYEGTADWAAIAAVKAAVMIPVVANGDLVCRRQHARMRELSRCDAVMVGRGACGRPWFPALLAGQCSQGDLRRVRFGDLVGEHYEAMLEHHGTRTGVRHARKHLGWYLDGFARSHGADVRADKAVLLRSEDPRTVLAVLRGLLGESSAADVEFFRPMPVQEAA